ncbi:MAG: alpha-ketoglutarate-dependent dioxygenase AlkB [Sorangiineae bacterium PRO1]|nr:alpha-ketoglutarate-dependent dioxygenase AlkB [Sorangiineae bacterium PRO1]
MRTELSLCSWLRLEPAFIGARESGALLSALVRELAWEAREIVLFGKRVVQPRLIAWAGSVPYRYSGQTLPAREPSPTLAELMERVERATCGDFNHVLVNRYRHGQDSMGFHSDDEPELGEDPLLASLSLGATRRFVIHPKKKSLGIASRTLELRDGDLLVMGGAFQHELRHGVPKQPGVSAERVNLTFRRLITSPGGS